MTDTTGLSPDRAQRLASDPLSSVWVGASAGSGKTKVLTDRVLRLLLSGTPPERVLCLTFTKAAAAEMANRVRDKLSLWATVSDERLTAELKSLTDRDPDAETTDAARRLFARVVDCPGGVRILTIHSFCQSLLRRFPIESGLPPGFDIVDERSAAQRLAEARDAVLRIGRNRPDSDVGRAVSDLTRDLTADAFTALTAEIAGERGRLSRLFEAEGGVSGAVAAAREALGVGEGETVESLLLSAADGVDEPALRGAVKALSRGSEADQNRGIALQRWLDADAEIRVARFDDWRSIFLTDKGASRKTLITAPAAKTDPQAKPALEAEAARLLEVVERMKSVSVATSTTSFLVVAGAVLKRYEEGKRASSLLDFDDLIHHALGLLTDERVPWVLYKLDGGLDHILIDEAQDTNPEQWRVVQALADEFFAGEGVEREVERTLFVVGDDKQSIFSFQRADPAEFARMRRRFEERANAAGKRWVPVDLDTSFRSTATVLRVVDEVFSRADARDGVIAPDGPAMRHHPFRVGHSGVVELWPLLEPAEEEETEAWAPPLTRGRADAPDARLADVIAATIRDWIDRGEVLRARGRTVRPGDVMVLVRRRSGFVVDLVRALKARDVPVSGVDRMVLRAQLAVSDLMALAAFLLLRDDDLTLACVLRGPLVGLSEEDLLDLAAPRSGTLWRELNERSSSDPRFRPVRDWLERLLSRSDFAPPHEFFAGVLAAPCPADPEGSGRRAIVARLGPDALDPLEEFLAATLLFELAEPPSLQLFHAWMNASDTDVKREMERGADAVRIMTVHGSKGLQAPIVFLPDTTTKPVMGPPVLWPDGEGPDVPLFAARRDREESLCAAVRARSNLKRDREYRRLLYVALTRAEDRLYVCGRLGKRGEGPEDSWYRLVERAMGDLAPAVEFDFTRLSPRGWTGTGRRLADDLPVLAKSDDTGVQVDELIVEPEPWFREPAPPEPAPSRPLTPSRPDEEEPAARSPVDPEDDGRRFQRGLLIHRLLQTLPDLPPEAREAACRRFLARKVHDLDLARQAALARETMAVLTDPDLAPLFASRSRTEVPIVGLVGNRAVSGRIDRLSIVGNEVWLIDYKTNRPPPRRAEDVPQVYRAQMDAYAAALEGIFPGKRVRRLILWTDGPFVTEV